MSIPVILMVDDEASVLGALKRVFRNDGYEIVSTTTPKEALDILRRMEVDVIVSDYRMPETTGVEFLAEARTIRPDAIRIILTGFADLKIAEDAINKGEVWRFFLKPWNNEELKTAVKQALQLFDLRRDNKRLLAVTRRQNQELQKRGESLEQTVEMQSLKLEETRVKLFQIEKIASIGLLAGGIAHEINNPLGGILLMSQLLLEDTPPHTPMYADLKEIEAAALHSKTIVENLLQFARQSRESGLGFARIEDVFDRVRKLLGHSLEIKNVTLKLEIPAHLPPVRGDSHRLQQVFMNLLANAGQAMPWGGDIRVKASLERNGDEIKITVIDTGVGIPADVIPKIFDPFFTTKAEGEGTGLGLSVTYSIVKDHGGSIEVESVLEKGSTFTVRLPTFVETERENIIEITEDQDSVTNADLMD